MISLTLPELHLNHYYFWMIGNQMNLFLLKSLILHP